jgi:hypothetical protein
MDRRLGIDSGQPPCPSPLRGTSLRSCPKHLQAFGVFQYVGGRRLCSRDRGGGVPPPSLEFIKIGREARRLRHVRITSPAPAGVPAGRGRVVRGMSKNDSRWGNRGKCHLHCSWLKNE